MTGYIYSAKCLITNKYYIGQTIQRPKSRWDRHKYDALNYKDWNDFGEIKYGRKFYNAIRKYGWNNFEFKIIKTCNNCTDDTLDMQEIFWISFYDSFNNGYNSTKGGKHGIISKEIMQRQYTQVINYTTGEIFESVSEASKIYNIPHANIIACCAGRRRSAEGYAWGYLDSELTSEEIKTKVEQATISNINHKKKLVYCITTGETFESLHIVKETYPKIDYRNLSACCNGKIKSCGKHPITGEKLEWKFIN